MAKELIGKRKEKGTWIKVYTLWTKVEIKVLAYFRKYNNQSATYRDIARAYVSSSYSNFKKACDSLTKRGYLDKLEDGSFKVNQSSLELIKRGKETIETDLPYFNESLKRLKQRKTL